MLSFIQTSNMAANFVIVANKKGEAENYRNTIAIVPPLLQCYCDIHVTYCNTIVIVKISPIVTLVILVRLELMH